MNMHEKILDNLQELVYIADMETYELLYYNKALAEEFHIPQRLQGKCYEILQGRRDPCPFCTNSKLSQVAAMSGNSTTSSSGVTFC